MWVRVGDHFLYIYTFVFCIYIYVWKLNQTVLELDFRAVKFLFFPRRDIYIYIYIYWRVTDMGRLFSFQRRVWRYQTVKGNVIRIRKSKKDRHNGQKKIDKRANNDLQNITPWGKRPLVLIIITLFRNCKFQIINTCTIVSAGILTNRRQWADVSKRTCH